MIFVNSKMLKASAIESRNLQSQLQQQLATLNSEYSNVQEELTNTRLEKQELELRAQTAPTLERKFINKLSLKDCLSSYSVSRESHRRRRESQSVRGKVPKA